MSNILYELSFEFDPILLIPLIMVVFIGFFPTLMKIYEKNNNEKKINHGFVKIFCICAAIHALLFGVIVIGIHMYGFNKLMNSYESGQYEVVEGYVENFKPMPYEGHSNESFEINGVEFSYSDYEITSGYHNAKSHGGVIEGNGQYLKIGYVHNVQGNTIVYIEQLE